MYGAAITYCFLRRHEATEAICDVDVSYLQLGSNQQSFERGLCEERAALNYHTTVTNPCPPPALTHYPFLFLPSSVTFSKINVKRCLNWVPGVGLSVLGNVYDNVT